MNKVSRSIFTSALIMGSAIASLVWAGGPIDRTFDINIAHGRVPKAMQAIRVKHGDHVKLRWTTDEPVTLHLHGYDIEKKVRPGVVTEFAFEARATGRFPVNLHGAGEHTHSHDGTTLLYLEVHPR